MPYGTLLPFISFSDQSNQIASSNTNNNNKAATKTPATGASSSPTPRMVDPLIDFPRRPRTPTATAACQARGIRPSKAPAVIGSRPITRSVTGSPPTQCVVQIQPKSQADQVPASPIVSPTRVHPSKSYSAVLTSPLSTSAVASPVASLAGSSLPSTSRVPALITHFEGRRIIPSPVRSMTSSKAPVAPSPSSSTSLVIRVSAMMTQAKTVEEQLAQLQTTMKERDEQLREPLLEEPEVLSYGTLQEMISNAVDQKVQAEGVRSQAYTRPYSRWIQAIQMPASYHSPKFQQFSGDDNPKQHVAHFIETCNNVGTDGHLLVKQFGRSLKGNAFEWFIELPIDSIDSWEQLEDSDVPGMLEQLLKKNMMQLLEAKRPKDVGKNSDPNYCKYHSLVGHPTEKCFVLKDKILELAMQGCIILEIDDNIAACNTIFVESDPSPRAANPRTNRKVFIPRTVGPTLWPAIKEFFTPTLALVATCSPQKVEQKREGKAPMGSADNINTCLQDVSITNAIRDNQDLPIRSRQALIKFVVAKDDWHAEVVQLRMRGHDEPKVGLSPSMIREEQPTGPSQIEEVHSTSISFKEATYCSKKGHITGLCSYLDQSKTGGSIAYFLTDGEEKTVFADECPFTESKATFAYAKFYSEEKSSASSSKITPPKVIKDEWASPNHKGHTEEPILRYVPQSHRKKGESAFTVYGREELSERLKALTGAATIPLPKLDNRGIVIEEKRGLPDLLKTQTQGFDPNAYRMMANAGSGFSLNQLQEKEVVVVQNLHQPKRISSCKEYEPVVISGKASVNQVTAKRKATTSEGTRTSAFDRIGIPEPRVSAFVRLSQEENRRSDVPPKPSKEPKPKVTKVWQKKGQEENVEPNVIAPPTMKPTEQPKKNIFQRLGAISESPTRIPVSQRLGKAGESSAKRTKTVRERYEATPLIVNVHVVIFLSSKKGDAKEEVVVVHHISIGEGNNPTLEELEEAPTTFEEGGQATIDQLKNVNLGTEEDPRLTFLSASLSVTEEKECVTLLSEYKNIFDWSYTEISGLDPTIAVHKLAVKIGVTPIKQTQKKEVDKLLKAYFIHEVKYPRWIANIVLVKKKNGQIRVYVDFRDLNKACPKDDFPLRITKLMVDARTGHEVLSFMDGSSSYNHIWMDPKDEEMTAFLKPKGIFYYKVMSFGLKNAGATYQRAMQRIFDDFLHKFVECYVNDLVVKTKARDDYLKDLRTIFERLKRHQLKMNPLKCALGVSSGRFLGFIVRHRDIEIDQTKIDVIQQMPKPKNLSELKSMQGHLAYIRRFISNLAGRCQPFSRLMKKDTPFE
ncbi:hypothetical protein H6P81_016258 [Aristolochia fimbriata]|uniref:Reverse transcriptase domain-containing protein n=1 Tax=Aristolochia fimbriata TaxID=158543 RepID=A0AAV7ECE7_ARIFI|nr:hypothetical protein H6P81_016258 [Aristolochia fimbriata]